MANTFTCPHCGSPVDHFNPRRKTAICPSCNERVPIPPDLRVTSRLSRFIPHPNNTRASSCIGGALLVVAVMVIIFSSVLQNFVNSLLFGAGHPRSTPTISRVTMISTPTAAQNDGEINPTQLHATRTARVQASQQAATNTAEALIVTRTAMAQATQEQATQAAVESIWQSEQAWPVSFSEDFTHNTRNWPTGDTSDNILTASHILTGGKYAWKESAKKSSYDLAFPDMNALSDGWVSAEVRLTSQPEDSPTTAGIVLRYNEQNHSFYYFSFDAHGGYSFSYYEGEKRKDLIYFAYTDAIAQGGSNRLAVSMVGPQFIFIVNDEVIDECWNDSSQAAGKVGLGLHLANDGDQATVVFKDLAIHTKQ